MRASFGKFGKSGAAALAMATAIAGASVIALGLSATPAFAKDKEKDKAPAKVTASPEFVKVAAPFQKQLQDVEAKKGKVSAEELKAAALPLVPQLAAMEPSVKNVADKVTWGQWQQIVGGYVDDKPLVLKGLQAMFDSGQLPPETSTTVAFFIGYTAYQLKDYPTTIKALGPVVAGNYKDEAAAAVLADAFEKSGQPAQALDALKTAIAAKKAAGGVSPEDWYSQGMRIAVKGKLNAASLEWSFLQVQAYPNALNWLNAGQLLNYASTGFQAQETLDVERLIDRSGGLSSDPKYVEREYVAYLQAADYRRNPGEVVRIAEKGIAAGALKADDTFVKEALTNARPRIAADKASLAGLATDAAKAPTGVSAAATADAFLSYGDSAKAEELYKLALTKGGVDANKDRILTRLGIAQIDQAKYPDAKATLAQVGGVRQQLAALWSIFADQKAAGK
ncbi:hypothetical protein [Novosphingobium sp. FKTRR1]|uniref:hypothetical protein n=1 Tax=Novosphingobium sp. FKTRR1 TaxID=2879118 RepID=UPI001CF072BA|nr:hypothetical protein [Novosphingobium sp. FKTRR1]